MKAWKAGKAAEGPGLVLVANEAGAAVGGPRAGACDQGG